MLLCNCTSPDGNLNRYGVEAAYKKAVKAEGLQNSHVSRLYMQGCVQIYQKFIRRGKIHAYTLSTVATVVKQRRHCLRRDKIQKKISKKDWVVFIQ